MDHTEGDSGSLQESCTPEEKPTLPCYQSAMEGDFIAHTQVLGGRAGTPSRMLFFLITVGGRLQESLMQT